MVKKVVFFNFFHNGDLHVSRNFVKVIAKECAERGIPCEYFHTCAHDILKDIDNVTFISNQYNLKHNLPSFMKDDILFLNTWYASIPDIFNKYSVSFDTLYFIFKINCSFLDIDLEKVDIMSLFPTIDFERFHIEPAKKWLSEHNKKRIFISNGATASGQSINFSMANIINKLSGFNPDVDFLVSNDENGINLKKDNIFLTRNIIQKNTCGDLNENGYIASHCSMIVGRYSGSYTFAMTKENYFDNPKTFIAFTHMNTKWTYHLLPEPKSKIINYPSTLNEEDVFQSIQNHIAECTHDSNI